MSRGRPKKSNKEVVVVAKEENKVVTETENKEIILEKEVTKEEEVNSKEPVVELERKVEKEKVNQEVKPSIVIKTTNRDIVVQNFRIGWTKILPVNTEVEFIEQDGNICKIRYDGNFYHVASIYLS